MQRSTGSGAKRLGFIDIAKGIAMLCIIWGHFGYWDGIGTGVPSIVTDAVYTFHVPLFFILSGYFFKPERPYSLKSEARHLLLPYFVTSLIVIVFGAARAYVSHGVDGAIEGAWSWTMAALYASGDRYAYVLFPVDSIGAIWFLWALFWARLGLHLVHKLRYPTLWAVVLFLVGFITSYYFWLPLSFQAGISAIIWLQLGVLARRHGIFTEKKPNAAMWAAMVVIWVLVIVFCGGCYPVNVAYPHGIFDFAGALCGSACVIGMSMLIERHLPRMSSLLQLIGRNTLAIMCFHLLDLNLFPTVTVQMYLYTALGIPMAVITLVLHYTIPFALCAFVRYLTPRWFASVFFKVDKANKAK